jgi:hypothetical protein
VEFENLCLYDWIRCSKRKKLATSNSKSTSNKIHDDEAQDEHYEYEVQHDYERENDASDSLETESVQDGDNEGDELDNDTPLPRHMYRFTPSHPLSKTHAAMIKAQNPMIVANFIGGILPCCDQGDRDYYCLTMLTLFKPWRDGLHLKQHDSSWDEAFLSHAFTERQVQLMQNFNIRYECLDACDDYRAQMKKGENIFFGYGENAEDELGDFDKDAFAQTECGKDGDELSYHMLDGNTIPLGRLELKRLKDAAEIRAVIQRSGWTYELSTSLDHAHYEPFLPQCKLAGSDWKARIQQQKQKMIDKKHETHHPTSSQYANHTSVKIIDKSYLEKRYYTTNQEDEINGICEQFHLNEEQERAFKIVSYHVVISNADQLRMYIGGMGGTGKSQVIRAISHYFKQRKESFHFIIVAPTGTAAALLGGSTYHSVFGINEMTGNTPAKILTQVRSRLHGVDYVFLDEVSMLSAYDLYKISAQLSKVLNRPDISFGGMNIIFAGDFAQLPPPMGGENVSLYSCSIGKISTSLRSQEEALGRALWHLITTVVILRKNMRQQTSTQEDNKLRTALENMRYKDCTPDDILFLRSRITSHAGKVSICSQEFRNVSIITAKNVQKDEINRLGCKKFAEETQQKLTHFYSEDSLAATNGGKSQKKPTKRASRKISSISKVLHQILWDLPHSSSDKHVAGKLSLCIGLPIMIKCNAATELCVTNGQEATVMGWQSKFGKQSQLMLDTLFVKLKNPPSNVKLDDLQENVVPLTCTSNTISCKLPDDSRLSISRTQVEVLPNFAMTDFASQGKTRPYNPVDLHNCRSHQAYYTALSRSATAAGTVILQGFDAKKITGRASGSLRQEFRELELLDEITKLQYERRLPKTVEGNRRNVLIHAYRVHKGMTYVPAVVHRSIRWSKADPMLDSTVDDLEWKTAEAKPVTTVNATKQHKRKLDDGPASEAKPCKRQQKLSKDASHPPSSHHASVSIYSYVPQGFSWSQNSCAYDAILGIIHSIWATDELLWSRTFSSINADLLGTLVTDFAENKAGLMTLETARDNLRRGMSSISQRLFAWGKFTSSQQILEYILTTPSMAFDSTLHCENQHTHAAHIEEDTCCVISAGINKNTSIEQWVTDLKEVTDIQCQSCDKFVLKYSCLSYKLPIIAFDFSSPVINVHFKVDMKGADVMYKLRGVIYYGDDHFTSRIIHESGFMMV